MRDLSLREASTWGVVREGDGALMVRVARGMQAGRRGATGGACHFECHTMDDAGLLHAVSAQGATAAHAALPSQTTTAPPTTVRMREERLLVGVSAARMALRRTILPFLRRDQIRVVLPQDSMDVLVTRREHPSFAFHAVADSEVGTSRVFFAVCETGLLSDLLERLEGMGVQPAGVVVAELGTWPLLEHVGLVSRQGRVLVVDASLDPPAIFDVVEGQLHALRLVAPATVVAGEKAIQEELQWLLDAMRSRSVVPPEADTQEASEAVVPDAEVRTLFLGRSQAFWQPFLEASVSGGGAGEADTQTEEENAHGVEAHAPAEDADRDGATADTYGVEARAPAEDVDRDGAAADTHGKEKHPQRGRWAPDFQELGLDLPGWAWLRPAGLALASREDQSRLLDFRDRGGLYGLMREWLVVWRMAGVLLILLTLVWGGREGVRYYVADARDQHFMHETKALFKEALPRVPVMLDPRLQLRQALAQTAPEGTQTLKMVTWLHLIQTRMEATSEVAWLRFRYEPGEVQLLGEVPSYKHLDMVQKALKSLSQVQEVRMEGAHIVTKTKKVQFRLRLL